MAKGPFGNMPNIPGLGSMMKQVQKMAEDTQKLEEELAEMKVEASSGGGMVTAVCKGEILEITIDPQVVDPDDVEMLQDLVISAVREVLEKASETKQARLSEITGGISLPGIF
jgi:DNA-binding YbaB/EbfC family protein